MASWTFFAASHGKSPCDGVVGATKRCLTRESLSHPTDNHILTAKDAFEYCEANIKGINFVFMDREEFVEPKRAFMKTHRVTLGDTIPGTQSFHQFEPVKVGVIAYKRTSKDPDFQGCRNFFTGKTQHELPAFDIIMQHFCCL